VRGVEATIDGELVSLDGKPALKIAGTGEVLRLAPLHRMVQWDTARKREQVPTEKERSAYSKLCAQRRETGRSIRVVGPLVATSTGQLPVLEVRQFAWQGM
jgi:hypothetical protein